MYKTNHHSHLLLFIKNVSSKRRSVAVTRKNTHFSTFERFSYTFFIRSSTDRHLLALARAICVARGMTTRGPSVGTRNYKGHCAASSLSVQYVMLPIACKVKIS